MSTQPITVLVVEDEEIISKALQTKLEKNNFSIHVAREGEAGLAMAASAKPDVILVDLLMPRVSGFEFLRRLKENSELKSIPAIVLTNLDDTSYQKKAMDLGAAEYLVKTRTNLDELKNKIHEYAKR
ncbi:MAG: response regulator [Patescibacteria group bacterium]